MHIVAINGIEPITAEYAISLIQGARRLRSEIKRIVTIQMSKRKSRTNYELYRAMFDTFRPILASFKAVISSHQAVLPSPPEKVKYEYQAYAGQYNSNIKRQLYYSLKGMLDFMCMDYRYSR